MVLELGEDVLDVTPSSSVKIKESHRRAKPMIHFEPTHKLAQEFAALYDELAARRAGTLKYSSQRA